MVPKLHMWPLKNDGSGCVTISISQGICIHFFPHFSFLFFPVEPEIQVDKVWVHADVSVEVEISCIVHAEPMAEVSNDTYDKCTLYQGYRNRYNLIKC